MARPNLSDLMARLGDATAADIKALWNAVLAGDLLPGDFIDTAAARIAMANGHGQILAAADFAQQLTDAIGELPAEYRAAAPMAHATDTVRLSTAVHTVIDPATDIAAMRAATSRLVRLARSETFEATQRQYHENMRTSDLVDGWSRGLESEACQLCRWWWRDGRIWPVTHSMPTHKGCHCRPIPTIKPAVVRRLSRQAMTDSAERNRAGNYQQRQRLNPSDYSSRATRRTT